MKEKFRKMFTYGAYPDNTDYREDAIGTLEQNKTEVTTSVFVTTMKTLNNINCVTTYLKKDKCCSNRELRLL